MNFLMNLDNLLAANNMTRAELARELKIPPSTINSWYYRGSDSISLKVLRQIADYFNVTLDYLVNGDKSVEIVLHGEDFSRRELELLLAYSRLLKESRGDKKDDN